MTSKEKMNVFITEGIKVLSLGLAFVEIALALGILFVNLRHI